MPRIVCMLGVIVSACVFGQIQNQGQNPAPQLPAPNVLEPSLNVLEPLVFSPSDLDLNNDGQLDDKDLQEALHGTQAFQDFKEPLIEQIRQSAKRRGYDLRHARKEHLDKLAFQIVSIHVPPPGSRPREAQAYSHRVLTRWDWNNGSVSSVAVTDDVFEKIKQGVMVFSLDREKQRWELIEIHSRAVFIRLKPRAPSKSTDG